MSLVAHLSGNLLRHPFFTPFHQPPAVFEIETPRGLYFQRQPLTNRAALVFLTLVALGGEEEQICLSRRAFLKACGLKLYNQDLEALLLRLTETEFHFHGNFYREGKFVDAGGLKLIDELVLPEKGRPLTVRLKPWIFSESYPVDMELFPP